MNLAVSGLGRAVFRRLKRNQQAFVGNFNCAGVNSGSSADVARAH